MVGNSRAARDQNRDDDRLPRIALRTKMFMNVRTVPRSLYGRMVSMINLRVRLCPKAGP